MSHTNNSKLDFQQIIKAVYDSAEHRLRTDSVVSFQGGEQEVIISHTDDSIRLGDGTSFITSSTVSGKVGLDVNIIAGDISIGGLSGSIAVSSVSITDVAVKLPSSALLNRNTVSFRNWGANTVYFGTSSVNVNSGYPKRSLEELVLSVSDNPSVEVWAVCAAGKTSQIRIIELA